VRKLTIIGPVKRVLPARVARYDREWCLRTSPTALLKTTTQKRKVDSGRVNRALLQNLLFLLLVSFSDT